MVVIERTMPVRNRFPVTFCTYIEKMGDVVPQPKVYVKNAIEIGKITLLKLIMP